MRGWFLQRGLCPQDIDDAMQEAYCSLVALDEVSHIANPAGYFFSILRNLLVRRPRPHQSVSFETLLDGEFCDEAWGHSIEDDVSDRLTAARVRAIIASLPPRCRRIVELRKIEGWSQKEIARHLEMTEKAVEKQIWLGVRMVRDIWSQSEQRMELRLRSMETAERRLEPAKS